MARVTNTHNKRKSVADRIELTTADASIELQDVHRRIVHAYEMAGLSELDKSEMLDRLFRRKRELLSVIRENGD